ncbi:hypothetical protein [Paraferrimonas sp. SM1919]|uniref:hypothetical protein n=1 Tax=Paraferrimonas sp. SM1919 TaxID=2662263 RepID=UPI0013D4507C|nr:hypothetical protein [Paraferrimonas sp. SM1919]
MKLEMKSIRDRGIPDKERVVMRALARIDIGQFALIEAGYSNGEINTETGDCFWFPDKVIDEGDWVVLYTKPGKSKEKVQKSGSLAHFFYWDKSRAKWSSNSKAPVVLQVDSWSFLPPDNT